jgi:hypothetical protein
VLILYFHQLLQLVGDQVGLEIIRQEILVVQVEVPLLELGLLLLEMLVVLVLLKVMLVVRVVVVIKAAVVAVRDRWEVMLHREKDMDLVVSGCKTI